MEKEFAQAKFRQFTNDYPDFRPAMGSYSPTPSGIYYSEIEEGLYAGDTKKAEILISLMQKDSATQKANLLTALRSSFSHRQPIPGAAFLRWAEKVLPSEDLERIENAQNNFVKNAIAAGIFKTDAVRTHQVGYTKKGPSPKVLLISP